MNDPSVLPLTIDQARIANDSLIEAHTRQMAPYGDRVRAAAIFDVQQHVSRFIADYEQRGLALPAIHAATPPIHKAGRFSR